MTDTGFVDRALAANVPDMSGTTQCPRPVPHVSPACPPVNGGVNPPVYPIDRTEEYQAAGIVGSGDAVIEYPGEGTHIKRGVGDLFIREDDPIVKMCAARDAEKAGGKIACQHCDELFMPRAKTGGRPQKFCTPECRRAADAEKKGAQSQRAQREPQRAENPAPEPLPNEFALVSNRPDDNDDPEPIETFSGVIPACDETRVDSVEGGASCLGHDVEIRQIDGRGNESRITLHSQNVVRFCRQVLWAHGFKNIKIATSSDVRGFGWYDLEDGNEPGSFY